MNSEKKRREGEMEALDLGCPNFFKGGQIRPYQNAYIGVKYCLRIMQSINIYNMKMGARWNSG